jgi:hypothetical protein
MPDVWKPTCGKDNVLDDRLNRGLWNGKPIYIHFTSQGGHDAINNDRKMTATPNTTRRGQAAKYGIYLNPSTQTFSPDDAHTLLFFAEERYRDSSTHCFVFAFHDLVNVEQAPISHGSWVQEVIYRHDIAFSEIDILYRGPNRFGSLSAQNHLRG